MERSKKLSMDNALLQNLTKAVFSNLSNDQLDSDELAKAVGMSCATFNRKPSRINGKSITKFICEIRLMEARHFLQEEVGTASEIAHKVGFSSSFIVPQGSRAIYECKKFHSGDAFYNLHK